jgi:hypothetical protein
VAVSLPLLVLLVIVLLQGALYVHALHVVASAAREGARAAAADGATVADGEARARALLGAGLGHAGSDLLVQVGEDADDVRVEVSGSMGLLGLRTAGAGTPVGLPLEGRGHATREGFRPARTAGGG